MPMVQITGSAKRGLPTPAVGPASGGHGHDVRRERAASPEPEGGTSAAGAVPRRGRGDPSRASVEGIGPGVPAAVGRQIERAAPDLW